ncbi:hypothetical protein CBS63078_4909 [Aspergillus niger]|uniref:EamA domain-containing protein n=1 Tax=Aspergillus niger TaxID=5061 RepID=A0A9W5ZR11_ASPNG|nr:hypothetical protein CBS133816_3375 [Aspergillus niger]KAI2865819.1 hypothetical protein CBS12448_1738 [Aspergillus niger]KAI2894641.1 hypothetical protein CBS13152_4206 [Aspergillus niger]KAI2907318.1 hypothetical protein CBS63078_4909 [Aspergillus niger]KAI2920440.1 hypothetical protein CBS147371_3125 [Aspergillus niger]
MSEPQSPSQEPQSHPNPEQQQQQQQKPHQTKWLLLALSSGAFAALNGLFAKLTTDTATTTFAAHLIHLFTSANNISDADLISSHPILMLLIRGLCFGLNILSNIIMWALFTRALTAGSSTTKVSITNTAANFLVTAMLGMGVFGERVGGWWWVGAAMMGVGCVIVGRRD